MQINKASERIFVVLAVALSFFILTSTSFYDQNLGLPDSTDPQADQGLFNFFDGLRDGLTAAVITILPIENTPTTPTPSCENTTICETSYITSCTNQTVESCTECQTVCTENCTQVCEEQYVNGEIREICSAECTEICETPECEAECTGSVQEVCNEEEVEVCTEQEVCGGIIQSQLGTLDFGILEEANSTTCGEVNTSLTLTANISATGDCFNITASNIIIDGSGYILTGNGSGRGVFSESGNVISNTTIKNFAGINNFTSGFNPGGKGNNLTIINNSFTTAADIGNQYYVSIISNNTLITNNTFFGISTDEDSEVLGVLSSNYFNVTIINNTFNLSDGNVGLSYESTIGGNITGNIFISTSSSVAITTPGFSQNTSYITNNIFSLDGDGAAINALSKVFVDSNNITTAVNGIVVTDGSINSTFQNNNVLVDDSESAGFYILSSGVGSYPTGNRFINNNITVLAGASFSDTTNISCVSDLIYNNSFGEIVWDDYTNLTSNLTLDINSTMFLVNNTVGLIDDAESLNLNGSATIKFFGLGYSAAPQLLKDGVRCDDGDACNISYAGGILTANISSFSNYTTTANCGEITASTTLSANLTYDGTGDECFLINSSNIIIDCAGYWMVGPSNDSATDNFAIATPTATGINNVTIKNCNFKGFTLATIRLRTQSYNITVYNNNFTSTNSGHSGGLIYVDEQGNGGLNVSNNRFEHAYVNASGTTGAWAVFLTTSSHNSFLVDNYINNFTYDGTNSCGGFQLSTAQNLTVQNNEFHSIICESADTASGVFTNGATANNPTIFNNIVNDTENGFFIQGTGGSVFNNTIYEAEIGIAYGLEGADRANNTFAYNNTFINTTVCDDLQLSSGVNISGQNYSNCGTDLQILSSTGFTYLGGFTTESLYVDDLSNITFINISIGNSSSYANYLDIESNLSPINLSRGFSYSSDWLFLNATLNPTFNDSANITLDKTYASNAAYTVLKDGSACTSCTKLGFNPVKFLVESFSNYSVTAASSSSSSSSSSSGGGEDPPAEDPADDSADDAVDDAAEDDPEVITEEPVATPEQVVEAIIEGEINIDVDVVETDVAEQDTADDTDYPDIVEETIIQDLEITYVNEGEIAIELIPEVEIISDKILENEQEVLEITQEEVVENIPTLEDDIQQEPPVTVETVTIPVENTQKTEVTAEAIVEQEIAPIENEDQVKEVLYNKILLESELSEEQVEEEVRRKVEALSLIEEKDVRFLSEEKIITSVVNKESPTSGITYSGENIEGVLLRAQNFINKKIVLQPGEKIEDKLKIQPGLTVSRREREISVVYDSEQGILSEKTIKIVEEPKLGGIIDVNSDKHLIDLYAVVPVVEKAYGVEGYSIEFIISDQAGDKYTELYGPYLIADQEGAIFAQNLKYNPQLFSGLHTISIKIFKNRRIISENEYEADLTTGLVIPTIAVREKLTEGEILEQTQETVETIKLIESKNVKFLSNKKTLRPGGMPLFGKFTGAARKRSLISTGQHTSGEYLKVRIVNPAKKIIAPGETVTEKYKIRTGLTTETDSREVQVKFLSQGEEVHQHQEKVTENSVLQGIVGLDARNRLLDIYVVIPKNRINLDKSYSFEFTIDEEEGGTKLTELYGPYTSLDGEGLLLAQEFLYNHKSYKGKHLAGIKIYEDGSLISNNAYKVNFRTGIIENLDTENFKTGSKLWFYLTLSLVVFILAGVLAKFTSSVNFGTELNLAYTRELPIPQKIIPKARFKKKKVEKLTLKERMHLINTELIKLRKPTPSKIVKKRSWLKTKRAKEQALDQEFEDISRKVHGYTKPEIKTGTSWDEQLEKINQELEEVKIRTKGKVVNVLPTLGRTQTSRKEKERLKKELGETESQINKPIAIAPPEQDYNSELVAIEEKLAHIDDFKPKRELIKRIPKKKIKKKIIKKKVINKRLIKEKRSEKINEELISLDKELEALPIETKGKVVTVLPLMGRTNFSPTERRRLRKRLQETEQKIADPIVIPTPRKDYTPEFMAIEEKLAHLDDFKPKKEQVKRKVDKKVKKKAVKKNVKKYNPNKIEQLDEELSQIEEALSEL